MSRCADADDRMFAASFPGRCRSLWDSLAIFGDSVTLCVRRQPSDMEAMMEPEATALTPDNCKVEIGGDGPADLIP
jgi:hypothetical protein